jgi:hypothetical protein
MAGDSSGVKLVGSSSNLQTLVTTGQVAPKSTQMNIIIDDVHASVVSVDAPDNGWHVSAVSGDNVQTVLQQLDEELYQVTQNITDLNSNNQVSTPSLDKVLAVGANAGGRIITGLPMPSALTDAASKGYVDSLGNSGGAHAAITNANPHLTTLDEILAITGGNVAGHTINMNGNVITNVGVTGAGNLGNAANKGDVSSAIANHASIVNAHLTPLQTILGNGNSAGSQKITNLATPTSPADAVTKAYVDSSVRTSGPADGIITQNPDGTLKNSSTTIDSIKYGFVATVDYYSDLYSLSGALSGDVANTRYTESIPSGILSGDYIPGIYRLLGSTWSIDNAFIQESYITGISGSIASEIAARISGDLALSGGLTEETAARVSGDIVLEYEIAGLSGALASIGNNTILQPQIDSLSGALAAEIVARELSDSNISAIQIDLASEVSARETLASDLSTETSARVTADNAKMTLQDGLGDHGSSIAGNVGVFDSTGQIIDSLQSLSGIMSVVIAAELSGLVISPADNLSQDQVNNIVYSGDFSPVQDRVTAAEANIAGMSGDLYAEISNNAARDNQLETNMLSFDLSILTEISDREDAVANEAILRDAAVSGEAVARMSGDAAGIEYTNSVLSSVSGLPAQVANLSNLVSSEVTARSNGDGALSSRIIALSGNVVGLSGTVNTKMALVPAATSGNVGMFNANGQVIDSAISAASLANIISLTSGEVSTAQLNAVSGALQNQLTALEGTASTHLVFTLINGNTEYSVAGDGFSITGQVTIPSVYNGLPVTTIGNLGFMNLGGITGVSLPSTLKTIGSGAFQGTGLTSIIIPNGVTSIGGIAFYNCTSLTTVVLPTGITSIGANLFQSCTSLKGISIPSNVVSIGADAFHSCTSLQSITIPDKVTSIGASAFQSCTGMVSATIGSSVTSIGGTAFVSNSNLRNVYVLGSTPATLGDSNTFVSTHAALRIWVPDSADATTYKAATNWSVYSAKIDTFAGLADVSSLSGNLAGQISSLSGIMSSVDSSLSGRITVLESTPAVSQVYHDYTLEGSGTSGDPLKVLSAGSAVMANTALFSGNDFLMDLTPYAMHNPGDDSVGPHVVNDYAVDTGNAEVAWFDDTNPEYLYGQFRMPPNIDVNGNFQVEVEGVPYTSAANKNIKMRFAYRTSKDDTQMSGAWTNLDSPDLALYPSGQVEIFQWSNSLLSGNIGSNDLVRYQISRIAPVGANLPGDYGLMHLRIRASRQVLMVKLNDYVVSLPAGSWDLIDPNVPSLNSLSGTYGKLQTYGFDDTTEEFIDSTFTLPADMDVSGNVTFAAYGTSSVAASSKSIKLNAYHSAAGAGESWDAAYTVVQSQDAALNSTQNLLDHIVWTTPVSGTLWAPQDHVRFRLSRVAGATNLSGDWNFANLDIRIPRS